MAAPAAHPLKSALCEAESSSMRRFLPGLALCLALAAPSAAQAAFAPRVQVTLDPSTAGTAPVVTAFVSVDPGDTPASRVTLLFPPSFSLQAPEGAAVCAAEVAAVRACARESEIGSLEAVTAGGEHATGTVHRVSAAAGVGLLAIMRGGGPLAGVAFAGNASTRPTGSQAITFEGLPALPLASLSLRLTGGDRGLIRTPGACGPHTVEARLTSHAGELAIAQAAVQIDGCLTLRISNVRLSASKLRAARSAGLRVSWTAAAAGRVTIAVQRRAGRTWRTARTLRRSSRAGANVFRFTGGGLKPGAYRFALSTPGGAKPALSRRFTVVGR
jgi:hypothetical protein